jgi:hypothetical protein
MERKDFLTDRERKWRRKREEIINYRDYLEYLPHRLRRLMSTRSPGTRHTPLPSEYVARALANALGKSKIAEADYTLEWHENSRLVMTTRIPSPGSTAILAVFEYEGDHRETAILVSAEDVTRILSAVDEVLEALKENFRKKLRELKSK